jgi:hypothetical protein
MSQVDDEVLFHRFHDDDNSVAMVIQHMAGNMASRWTNIFEEDGEKIWRNRDKEFVPHLFTKAEIMEEWERGWRILFDTLSRLTEEDLPRVIYIRKEAHTVENAILRQLCHYSYHCGQIVYKCKQSCSESWTSLSIPKDKSTAYNARKFEQIQEDKHFLDDLLDTPH